jgi:hypothetical protein
MRGINLAEQAHVVNVLPPKNISGGAIGDRFKMSHHQKASIVVQVGVSAAAFTKIIVKECDAATAGTATAIAYRLYAEETATGDTLGAKEAVAATGRTPSANDNIMYVIDLDATDLTDGYKWVEVSLTNTSGNSVLASIVAVLTGPRYVGSADGLTAIA